MDLDTVYSGTAYNFELYQNSDETLEIEWYDAEGVLADLTGFSAAMQFKAAGSDVVAYEASTANGRIVLTSPGVIVITFDHTTTAPVAPGTYDYDLHLWTTTRSEYPFYGKVLLRKRISA